MSSAILYGAIVIIWLCVLIPRWLRREPSSGSGEREVPVVTTEEHQETEVSRPVASGPAAPGSGGSRPQGPRHDTEHARVIGARRRLLGMLMLLAAGAFILYLMQLAAWWVVIPPSIMLGGYVLLLREASRADAERAADTQARRTAPPAPVTPEPAVVTAEPAGVTAERAVVAAEPAFAAAGPAPDAEVIDITTRVNEEFYDQYADAKLRAVGD